MTDRTGNKGVTAALAFLWRAMSAARKRHFLVAMFVMMLGTVTELLTIGAVLPFLAIVSDPARADTLPLLGDAANLLGLEGFEGLVMVAALLLIGAAVFGALMRIALTWISLGFVLSLSHEIGREVFARMLRQPYGYYVSRNTSELLSGIDKVQTVVWSVLMPGMQGIASTVMSLGIAALLFYIDPFTASVAAGSMAFAYVSVALLVRRRLHSNSERLADAATRRVQTIQEGLGGIRDILLEQSQDVFEQKFRRLDWSYRRAQTVNNFILLSPRYVVEGAGIVLIAGLAVHLAGKPGGLIAALPILGALALGAQRVLPLLQQAYTGWSSLAGNRQILIDVTDLMAAPVVTSLPRDRAAPVAAFRESLALSKVSFRFGARDEPALKGIDLVIPKGQNVGFIGETGSGKSTMLDIVMGLLDPSEGAVLIDGEPLSDANRALWQAQIAHVPQTIFLADATIAANIAFGEHDAEIDHARVTEAARVAQIHDFVSGLPQGYATEVGERGVRLSGGQRQRIGIARALYKRAPVLILDEATSALDDATEAAIIRSLNTIDKDVTILMIAHRTSTLAGCDVVVGLANGEIVRRGTYAEMVAGA